MLTILSYFSISESKNSKKEGREVWCFGHIFVKLVQCFPPKAYSLLTESYL